MNKSNQIRNLILCFIMACGLVIGAQAQKFGHLNSTLLMSELPAIKEADSQLQTFQEQLTKAGQDMVTKFQNNYAEYQTKVNDGSLSQLQAQEIETSLQNEQMDIQNYQQEVQNQVLQKRQELYDPIFDKVRNIIEQYGKDNGYTMIFDTSVGAILFEDSEDLTEAVKALL